MKNDLQSRKENSISRQIRTLVLTTLQANGDEDAEVLAKKVGQVYSHRGTLVHEGWLDPSTLSKTTSDTKNIVERVLRARFI